MEEEDKSCTQHDKMRVIIDTVYLPTKRAVRKLSQPSIIYFMRKSTTF